MSWKTLVGVVLTAGLAAFTLAYASPSLMLLVKDFDPQNLGHSLSAAVNVMTFWLLAVFSIGMARLSGVALTKAVLWVFGLWAAYTGFFLTIAALAQTALKQMGSK